MELHSILSSKVLLVEIDGENLILDTGATHSLFDPPQGSRFLEGLGIRSSPANLLIPFSRIRETVSRLHPRSRVDALVGVDALAMVNLFVDFPSMRVGIERETASSSVPHLPNDVFVSEVVMGVPVIQMRVGESASWLRLVFDTGCENGYLLDLPEGGLVLPDLQDHHPLTGPISAECKAYGVAIRTHAGEIMMDDLPFGRLSGMLGASVRMLGLDGVVGLSVARSAPMFLGQGLKSVGFMNLTKDAD